MDNSAGTKWMTATPNQAWRRLLDNQIAAALKISLLIPQESSPICNRCGNYNSLDHFEVCQQNKSINKQQCGRHNHIRDKIFLAAQKDKTIIATKEPPLPEQPNIPNHRADLKIRAPAGSAINHSYFGLHDIMVKDVLTAHTNNARLIARNEGQQANITDITTMARKIIQAGLGVGVAQKANTYRLHTAAGTKVTALLISSAGTLHATFYKFLKKIFPDSTMRGSVLTDIAIGLIRARANMYNHVYVLEDGVADTQQ